MISDYSVTGMHCASCSKSVERSVRNVSGVEAASVNLMTESLRVRSEKDLSDEIINAVQNAGFNAKKAEKPIEQYKLDKERRLYEQRSKKIRLITAIVFTLPLFYIAMAHMIGLPSYPSPDTMPELYCLALFLLLIPILIVGFPLLSDGIIALYKLRPNMNSLVTVGAISSIVYSVIMTVFVFMGKTEHVHETYYESAGVVLTLVMLGKYLETGAKFKTAETVDGLMKLIPSNASVVCSDGTEARVKSEELMKDDHIRVRPGEQFPTDGKIISGATAVDLSLLTGESMPVDKIVNDEVVGGSLNISGEVDVIVTQDVENNLLSGIVQRIFEAQSEKAPVSRLADRVCSVFVPCVFAIAVLSAIIWIIAGESAGFVLKIFTSVLVIACPCALGLATPTAVMVGTGNAARHGVLIRSGEVLEKACNIKTVLFDKTGTLTEGMPEVTIVKSFVPEKTENDIVELILTAEQGSKHPLAGCVKEYAQKNGIEPLSYSEFKSEAGKGVSAKIDGITYRVGKAESAEEPCSEFFGKTVMHLTEGDKKIGAIAVSDKVRVGAREVVDKLKSEGIICAIVSGDKQSVVTSLADELGIEKAIGDCMPEAKKDSIDEIKKELNEKEMVAMVGDGINDAIAINSADIGFAMGNGTDIALSASDIVLTNDDLNSVLYAIRVAKKTLRVIKRNLTFAFMYNCLCIPVAAGLLYAFGGPALSPVFAAIAMCASSVTVCLGAQGAGRIK